MDLIILSSCLALSDTVMRVVGTDQASTARWEALKQVDPLAQPQDRGQGARTGTGEGWGARLPGEEAATRPGTP